MKTYTLTCPDSDCAHEFTLECDPETLADGGELIECPKCLDEWEWEHDPATDVLTLIPDDYEDDEPITDAEIEDGAEDEDDDG